LGPVVVLTALEAIFAGCVCYIGPDRCGDAVRDTGEECDGQDLGAGCAPLDGTASCRADCTLDTTSCAACGDGLATAGEPCDGFDLRGETCVSLGYEGGTLGCAACTLNESDCFRCGDGELGGTEECDGTKLPTTSCSELGFGDGTISCGPDCRFDFSGCDGFNGWALSFDGVDDVLYCPILDLALPAAEWTWEGWVYIDPSGPWWGTIFQKWRWDGEIGMEGRSWELLMFQDGLVSVEQDWSCGGSSAGTVQTFAIPAWHHLALAWGPIGNGNSGYTFFQNGTLLAEDTVGAVPDGCAIAGSQQPVLMGNNGCDDPPSPLSGLSCTPFLGKLDEVRVWNYKRTAAEVAADYMLQLSGNEPGLVAYWPFDEGKGDLTLEVVSGTPCQRGTVAGEDAADPAWVSETPF
jgi:hypothetical protein